MKQKKQNSNKINDIQKVKVYVMVSGNYCGFNEMSFDVVYDVTNDKCINGIYSDITKEKLKNWNPLKDGGGYSDVALKNAIKIRGKYYIEI